MQLRGRKLGAVRLVRQVDAREQPARLAHCGAAAEYPRDELELRDVVEALHRLEIVRVADEVQPRHAESLLVYSIIEQRVAAGDVGHTDDRVVPVERAAVAEAQRIFARQDNDLVPVREFIIQRTAEIKILCFIACSCAHAYFS